MFVINLNCLWRGHNCHQNFPFQQFAPEFPSMVLTRAASGASTHPTQPMDYHVFLSFRGPDSRRTFTDHLYAALVRKGIVTFRDDLEIEKGDAVSEKLRNAIRQSRYFIIVLSKDFSSSRWCLDELQQIVQTKPKNTIFPVFYDVQAGYIGHDQGGRLELHRGRCSEAQITQWRKALSKVSKFTGWFTQNKHEAKLVEEIATHIWNKLCEQLPSNFEYLVGDIRSKAKKIISHLRIGLDEKCFIGIWGMGGAGKTTLGRVVYDIATKKGNFDASCFLTDIRKDSEKFGVVHLQKKLLSNLKLGEPNNIKDSFHGAEIIRSFVRDKKVLIVFDDVSHRRQLDNLAKNKDWFGAGSKIIITTRDKHLLTRYEDFYDYKVDMLCDEEALKLLCQKAFKKDKPGEDITDLSDKVVEYAGGHPMALEALGSFLCGREKYEWRCITERLRQSLNKEILSELRISYDELEDKCKTVFLDVACFFNNEAKFTVENMLKKCGLDEKVEVKVLTEKSLLSFSQSSKTSRQCQNMHDNLQKMRVNTEMEAWLHEMLEEEASKEYLCMHDLIREMGRNIVIRESPINAGRRSRLWSLEDINLVLKENKGTEHVQSIVLETKQVFKAKWDPRCFKRMINLRLLDLSNVHLSKQLESLPTALKILRWNGYAWERLPTIEKLWNLESLQLCNSKIKTLWKENAIFDHILDKLRIINISGSECLSETPDFSVTPNLEELLLDGCRNLTLVHDSVAKLKKLVKLSLKNCRLLDDLPGKLETNNLKEFILMGCIGLEKLPKFGEGMTSLYFFDVSGTSITQIPSSINNLTNLLILDLWGCDKLDSLPADLPPALIACPISSPDLSKAIAHQLNYSALRVPKEREFQRPRDLQGPIHIFDGIRAGERILEWFNWTQYCWGKDTSGEFVTITAEMPSNVVADSNEQCRGIAICLYLKSLPQVSESYIVWRFHDKSHTTKTKMHGIQTPDDNDEWKVYVGFYPIDTERHQQHPSDGEDTQLLDLTISFLTSDTARDLHDLAIMGCGWRLTSKLDFDKWWENRALPPPSGHDFYNCESGESSRSPAQKKGKRKIQEIQENGENGRSAAQRKGKRKTSENQRLAGKGSSNY